MKYRKCSVITCLYSQLCRHEDVHLELVYGLHQTLKNDSTKDRQQKRQYIEGIEAHALNMFNDMRSFPITI